MRLEEEIKLIESIKTKYPYYVTRDGRFFNKDFKQLKPSKGGYKRKYLRLAYTSKEGKKKKEYAHRVVASEFIGKCPTGFECAHLDGNTENNHYKNLKWCSPKENSSHKIIHGTSGKGEKNSMAKINDYQASTIIKIYPLVKTKYLAQYYKTSPGNINYISTGRSRYKDEYKRYYKSNKTASLIKRYNGARKYKQ